MKQKMASSIENSREAQQKREAENGISIQRQAAQSLLNSLCFLIAALQSHTRGV